MTESLAENSDTWKTPIHYTSIVPHVSCAGSATDARLYVLFTNQNGSTGCWWISLDFDEGLALLKFVDAPEENCIIWRNVKKEKTGLFGHETTVSKKVVEIRLRKDIQLKP